MYISNTIDSWEKTINDNNYSFYIKQFEGSDKFIIERFVGTLTNLNLDFCLSHEVDEKPSREEVENFFTNQSIIQIP